MKIEELGIHKKSCWIFSSSNELYFNWPSFPILRLEFQRYFKSKGGTQKVNYWSKLQQGYLSHFRYLCSTEKRIKLELKQRSFYPCLFRSYSRKNFERLLKHNNDFGILCCWKSLMCRVQLLKTLFWWELEWSSCEYQKFAI